VAEVGLKHSFALDEHGIYHGRLDCNGVRFAWMCPSCERDICACGGIDECRYCDECCGGEFCNARGSCRAWRAALAGGK